ncbi:phosphatase PAP2 family protein [Halorubrum sp. DTA46]|uniref:phosphatase PAP2 family protein n=1 Tax=Halorubrum sp. DTA46 TaxID=3402162 RepID=UPI003AAD511E
MNPLVSVALSLLAWVGTMLFVASVVIIGPRRLYDLWNETIPRLRESKYALAMLGGVLLVSAVGRGALASVSTIVGLQLTGTIYAIEGDFVAWVQASFVVPELTMYFSWVYVYGYVFLLAFPFVAYLALPKTTTLKRLIVAYALNYAIGLVIYTIVFAHGPRNVMPDMVTSLLYTYNPEFQALTDEVNENTNVFPSLHTSLAVTAATFAALTRDEYPLWTPIAAWFAVSVVIATMYLGIHWLTDVIGGIVLALGAVFLAYRFVDPADGDSRSEDETEAVRGADVEPTATDE